jgi:uncharacterized membrane protein YgcG
VRRLVVVLWVFALLLVAGGPALAVPPFRLDEQVVDQVGALSGEEARVEEALDQLRADDGTQLWVAFVSSFDGAPGRQWATDAAAASQLGSTDVLFAVAVDDRAYGVSVDDGFRLSDEEVDALLAEDVEPALSDGDCAPGRRSSRTRARPTRTPASPPRSCRTGRVLRSWSSTSRCRPRGSTSTSPAPSTARRR